ncbi:MAG TPA: cytochrome c [Vicinamibacterales bacterium]|nr:cytochrome c [Vicinamibacterales bacterium]
MTSTWTYRTRHTLVLAGLSLAGALLASPAQAQGSSATGDYLFRTYCAACHGQTAKGNGPLAESMRKRPADLTEIAKRNKGVFPKEQVYRMIDGREPVKGHGGPDMPVWGDVFTRAVEGGDPNIVQKRIEALVNYLAGIQARNTADN